MNYSFIVFLLNELIPSYTSRKLLNYYKLGFCIKNVFYRKCFIFILLFYSYLVYNVLDLSYNILNMKTKWFHSRHTFYFYFKFTLKYNSCQLFTQKHCIIIVTIPNKIFYKQISKTEYIIFIEKYFTIMYSYPELGKLTNFFNSSS